MKNRLLWRLAPICLALLAACTPDAGGPGALPSQMPAFSYEAEQAQYRPGDPGVRASGFVNTEESPVEDAETAIRRAREECTVTYDTVSAWYDPTADMWKVSFSTAGMAGGDQCVYLGSDGVTRLIVYGE